MHLIVQAFTQLFLEIATGQAQEQGFTLQKSEDTQEDTAVTAWTMKMGETTFSFTITTERTQPVQMPNVNFPSDQTLICTLTNSGTVCKFRLHWGNLLWSAEMPDQIPRSLSKRLKRVNEDPNLLTSHEVALFARSFMHLYAPTRHAL